MTEPDQDPAPRECVYCGESKAVAAQLTGDLWTVHCNTRDCYAFAGSYVTRDEAVSAWDEVAECVASCRIQKQAEASR